MLWVDNKCVGRLSTVLGKRKNWGWQRNAAIDCYWSNGKSVTNTSAYVSFFFYFDLVSYSCISEHALQLLRSTWLLDNPALFSTGRPTSLFPTRHWFYVLQMSAAAWFIIRSILSFILINACVIDRSWSSLDQQKNRNSDVGLFPPRWLARENRTKSSRPTGPPWWEKK